MMDGYALRGADWQAGRRLFHVTGTAPAGRPAVVLSDKPGACVEVMTGAPLPVGADSIVLLEEISRPGADEILIGGAAEVAAGRFIHRAGSDAPAGEVLLRPGMLLGSPEIAVAAACGAAVLQVSCFPRVTVIATGDELVAVDATPRPHQIRQSNAHAIDCALRRAGYPPSQVIALGDDAHSSGNILLDEMNARDWLVLTGAVSRGARDFIPEFFDRHCTRLFHGVAQRPGKPAGCWLGPAGQMIVALPGNPVAALTGLHVFVLPALAVASGMPVPVARRVIPLGRLEGLPHMTHHLPVALDADGRARAAATANSGDMIGLLKSDGFITMPPREETPVIPAAYPFTPWL